MTQYNKSESRVKWSQGDELNKWVTCLDCFHEYYIESFELDPCCPVCGSREYEESEPEIYLDLMELGDF